MNNNGAHRKKDSARIVWDSNPRRAPNPTIETVKKIADALGASLDDLMK